MRGTGLPGHFAIGLTHGEKSERAVQPGCAHRDGGSARATVRRALVRPVISGDAYTATTQLQ